MSQQNITKLIEAWGNMPITAWAGHKYGWITEDNQPIVLADWQQAVLGEFWQRRDVVSTLFISCPKKAGKTLLNSILTCYRWLTRPGIHFALGNDWEQGAMLQGAMIADMVKRHPVLKSYVKANKNELIFTPTDSKLITLAADYAGSAGHNFLTVSFTEVWAFTYENHIRLYEELTPPPLSGALRVVDSYAGFEGESLLLKQIWERGENGQRINDGWPIFLTGQQLSYIHTGEDAQKACWRGTEDERKAYYQEQSETLRPNTFSRLHLNLWTVGEGNFCSPDDWQLCIDKNHKPLPPGSLQTIYLGLDLATSAGGDQAAMVGVYRDGNKLKLAFHKVWDNQHRKKIRGAKEGQDRLKLKGIVYPYILELKKHYHIASLHFDPFQALSLAEDFRAAGLRCVEVTQSHASRGPLDTALQDLVNTHRLVLYPHSDINNLSSQAQAKELPNGQIFLKKMSGRSKIDLLISLSNVADIGSRPQGWAGTWNGILGAGAVWSGSDGVVHSNQVEPPPKRKGVKMGGENRWEKHNGKIL